jgi:Terminase RNaseH-like domain
VTLNIGIDIGQLADPTAIAVTEQRNNHVFTLRLERLPLRQSYPAQVRRVVELLGNLRRWAHDNGRPYRPTVYVDVTGVGRSPYDMLVETVHPSVRVVAVTLTPGSETTRKGHELHIPKLTLVDRLRRLAEEERLHIPPASNEARAITRELRMFAGTKTGPDSLSTGARSGSHDDLVVALALAAFDAGSATTPTTVRDGDMSGGTSRAHPRVIRPKREGDPTLTLVRFAYDGAVYADQNGNLIHKPNRPVYT